MILRVFAALLCSFTLFASPVTPAPSPENWRHSADFQCMALTAFAEARGEGDLGMALVVKSMLNRLEWERNTRPACGIARKSYDGFRRWPAGAEPHALDPESWGRAQVVTELVIRGEIDLGPCDRATHFLNPSKLSRLPRWASPKARVCRVGRHVAYALKR